MINRLLLVDFEEVKKKGKEFINKGIKYGWGIGMKINLFGIVIKLNDILMIMKIYNF